MTCDWRMAFSYLLPFLLHTMFLHRVRRLQMSASHSRRVVVDRIFFLTFLSFQSWLVTYNISSCFRSSISKRHISYNQHKAYQSIEVVEISHFCDWHQILELATFWFTKLFSNWLWSKTFFRAVKASNVLFNWNLYCWDFDAVCFQYPLHFFFWQRTATNFKHYTDLSDDLWVYENAHSLSSYSKGKNILQSLLPNSSFSAQNIQMTNHESIFSVFSRPNKNLLKRIYF